MKLTDTNQPNIVAAQITRVGRKSILVVTEKGRLLRIPVNEKLKQLFSYDWLTSPSLAVAPAKN